MGRGSGFKQNFAFCDISVNPSEQKASMGLPFLGKASVIKELIR